MMPKIVFSWLSFTVLTYIGRHPELICSYTSPSRILYIYWLKGLIILLLFWLGCFVGINLIRNATLGVHMGRKSVTKTRPFSLYKPCQQIYPVRK